MAAVIGDPRQPTPTTTASSSSPVAVPLFGPAPGPLPGRLGQDDAAGTPGGATGVPVSPADVGRGLRPVAPSEIVKRALRYGPHRSQVARLRRPRWPVAERLPVVALVHGGFWSWPSSRHLMGWVGRDAVRRGWCSFEIGYRRLGRLGGGGGYPQSFDDVVAAVQTLVSEAPIGVDPDRIVVVGHSAGGHLALSVAPRLQDLVLGTIAVSAPLDLTRAVDAGSAPAARLLADAHGAADLVSPIDMNAPDCRVGVVHSTSDATVRADHSVRYADRLRSAGRTVDVRLVGREGHRAGLRPSSATWAATVDLIDGWMSHRAGGRSRAGGGAHG